MGVMKTARILTYDYHYWFQPHWRDKYGLGADRLYLKMDKWLENTLEISDYRIYDRNQKSYWLHANKYQIDFREENHYSFFALCWDSQVEDYYNSYNVKRNR